jgi:uncharacterized protein YllA (UPF0747 family)
MDALNEHLRIKECEQGLMSTNVYGIIKQLDFVVKDVIRLINKRKETDLDLYAEIEQKTG